MADKGVSQGDLERHIVGSAAAAYRVGEIARLLPMVLLRGVARVHEAFASWRSRGDLEHRVQLLEDLTAFELWNTPDVAAALAVPVPGARTLMLDLLGLRDLVDDLGLGKYRRWLPKYLAKEFGRVALGVAEPLYTEWPVGLTWPNAGKRPKQRPGSMGGFRLEDLERKMTWLVHCVVLKQPKKRFARESGTTRSNLQNSIIRTQTLLDCIDATVPDISPAS